MPPRTNTMRDKARELEDFKAAAEHLNQARRCLDAAYSSAGASRNPGVEFLDEVYAIGALQFHLSTVDTLLFRKIEALKGSPRTLSCGCCEGGCICFFHSDKPPLPLPLCNYHSNDRSARTGEDEAPEDK